MIEPFVQSCRLATRVMSHPAVARRWEESSALEGFTVGGVASHLYAALRRFEIALDDDVPDPAVVVGLADFYGRNRVDGPDDLAEGLHPVIRDDAEERARFGAASVAERFEQLTDRLGARLPAEPPDRLVPVWTVPGGATPLSAYLRTRVIELVVHSDDLATSAGVEPLEIPEPAVSVAVEAFVELARARSGDLAVIRAFTRRERAEPDALRVL